MSFKKLQPYVGQWYATHKQFRGDGAVASLTAIQHLQLQGSDLHELSLRTQLLKHVWR